jgi:hypothetical protein
MYCEIVVEHRKQIDANRLRLAVLQLFGNQLPLDEAYNRSAIYRVAAPRSSLCAFEVARNCFVILRKVSDIRLSTFHLEGSGPNVTVNTMLQEVQEFSNRLLSQLGRGGNTGSSYKVRNLSVRLFEDNGRETGVEGELVTLGAIFKGKFAWKEIAPAVITFFTALFLFWRGLSDQSVKAAVASLLIVLVFTLVAVIAEKLHGRNRMNFKLRPY